MVVQNNQCVDAEKKKSQKLIAPYGQRTVKCDAESNHVRYYEHFAENNK